jgi:hypothetical protein
MCREGDDPPDRRSLPSGRPLRAGPVGRSILPLWMGLGKALGQLRGHNFFNVPADKKVPKLVEIAAYSERPSANMIDFMRNNAIHSAWPQADQWLTSDLGGNIENFSPDDLLAN